MKDRNLEDKIKNIQTFLEFWLKFQEVYRQAVSKKTFSVPGGDVFLSTRQLVNSRFEDLMDLLEIEPKNRMVKCYPIYEILSFEDFSAISDKRLDRLKDCWMDSYIFLHSLAARYKRKKQRIAKFNRFFYTVKKLTKRGRR